MVHSLRKNTNFSNTFSALAETLCLFEKYLRRRCYSKASPIVTNPFRGDESLSKIGLLLSKRKQKQTNLSSMKHLLKPGANELLVQTRQANILLLLFRRTTFCLLTPRSKCFCLSRISHLRGSRVPVCTFLHALIFTQSLSEKETNLTSSALRILLVQNVFTHLSCTLSRCFRSICSLNEK